MLLRAKDVIGIKVISLYEGRFLDNVDDVIFDPKSNVVQALLIDNGGIFSSAKLILFNDIKGIGPDAVIVENNKAVKKVSEVPEPIPTIVKGQTYLTKTRIVTEDGQDLGLVTDLLFDSASGKVEEFEVSQGSFQDLQGGKKRVKTDDIITVGKDATIVKGYVVSIFDQQAELQGIKGAFNQTVTNVNQQAPVIVNQAQDAIKQVGKKAKSLEDQMRQDQNLRKKIDKTTDNARETINRGVAQAKTDVPAFIEETNTVIQNFFDQPRTRSEIDAFQKSANNLSKNVQSAIFKTRSKISEQQTRNALGKYLTKTILSPNDEILANRGDMITNTIVKKANQVGMLDQVLGNTSNDPVE